MQSVALGAAFAQTLIKVVWWKKSRQLGARRWKDVSFVTVNLFAQSVWGYCKGKQWKTLNLYMLRIKETS